jgi:hypothetical protein
LAGGLRSTTLSALKVCKKCGLAKPPETFGRRKGTMDGLHSHCKECFNKARSVFKGERMPVLEPTVVEKRCSRCQGVHPAASFPRNAAMRDGLHMYCKMCHSKTQKELRRRQAKRDREPVLPQPWATCRVCNTAKPAADFGQQGSAAIGTEPVCRTCKGRHTSGVASSPERCSTTSTTGNSDLADHEHGGSGNTV